MSRVNQWLLLLLVCVAVPCCLSLCDISAARRQAHRGTCQQVARPFKKSEAVAKQAADQAGVVFEELIEAYTVYPDCITAFFLFQFFFLVFS